MTVGSRSGPTTLRVPSGPGRVDGTEMGHLGTNRGRARWLAGAPRAELRKLYQFVPILYHWGVVRLHGLRGCPICVPILSHCCPTFGHLGPAADPLGGDNLHGVIDVPSFCPNLVPVLDHWCGGCRLPNLPPCLRYGRGLARGSYKEHTAMKDPANFGRPYPQE